jgi:hypothetical protein
MPSSQILVVLVVLVALLALPADGETYIIPVWASALPASDGEWWASSTVINPNDFAVTARVVRVFPLRTAECASCTGEGATVTIEPGASWPLTPPSGQRGRQLVAGAVELQTSAPVHIQLAAYRPGPLEIRQRVDVARAWLLPGIRTISVVERTVNSDWRINVFIVNPNSTALRVNVWAADRAENEVDAIVAPGTTAVVNLPAPRCNGFPCPVIAVYPIPSLSVYVESDGPFLASVSSVGRTWAVFSLADEAAVARVDCRNR